MYGNDDADESYNQALPLIDAHPDLKLIMAPTTVGIAAAAKAMQDEGLCETVKVSGLGLPTRCSRTPRTVARPQFALWSFVDLGYLTFYAAHGIARARSRPRRERRSPPAAWGTTRSRRTRPATRACGS